MRRVLMGICSSLLVSPAVAQTLSIPAGMSDEASLPRTMPEFAKEVIASQQGVAADPAALFRAQLAAALYGDALKSLEKLRAPIANDPSPRVRARYWEYILYARSALEAGAKAGFEAAYRDTFRAMVAPLDNRTSAIVV